MANYSQRYTARYLHNFADLQHTIKVLIIHDDPSVTKMLISYLEENGYGALDGTSWKNALHIYDNTDIDIILAGIPNPEHDGLDILKSINFEQNHSEVIIFTPHHEISISLQAFRLGVSTVIASPIAPDDLDNALHKAVKRIMAHRKLQAFEEKMKGVSLSSPKTTANTDKYISKEFLQGTIHNLNGPLSVVSGNVQLLQMGLENLVTFLKENKDSFEIAVFYELLHKIEHYSEYLISALKAGDKMRDMICNLLTKWKKDSGKLTELININELIRLEAEYLNSNMIFKNQIKKTFLFVEDIPPIEAVYSDFSETLNNLIHNSIDAMRNTDRKELTIKTWHDEDIIYVEIRDTGCGIGEEDRNNIFKPFFTTKNNQPASLNLIGGTGLGLTSCLTLMERYRATFTVQSKLNHGTIILWKIPKEQSPICGRANQNNIQNNMAQIELF